jgi:hypothetical protein
MLTVTSSQAGERASYIIQVIQNIRSLLFSVQTLLRFDLRTVLRKLFTSRVGLFQQQG